MFYLNTSVKIISEVKSTFSFYLTPCILSFACGLFLGFYCTPVLQKVYIGATCLIFLIGMIVSIFGATESPNAALIRQGGFGSLTVFGFVPLCREYTCAVVLIFTLFDHNI